MALTQQVQTWVKTGNEVSLSAYLENNTSVWANDKTGLLSQMMTDDVTLAMAQHMIKYQLDYIPQVNILNSNFAGTSSPPVHNGNKIISMNVYTTSNVFPIPVGEYAFATYDAARALQHELTHVKLYFEKFDYTDIGRWGHDENDVHRDSLENLEPYLNATAAGLGVDPSKLIRTGYNKNGSFSEIFDKENTPGTYAYYQKYKNDPSKASINATLYGGGLGDTFEGGLGNENFYGGFSDDSLSGGAGMDELYGGTGNDTLAGYNGYGGRDDVKDTLTGGTGYDTYVTNNCDTIYDSDGSGMVVFEGTLLTGGTREAGQGCEDEDGEKEYKGNGGTYTLSGGLLRFTQDGTGRQVSITGFSNGQLGITLTKNPADSEECEEGKCPHPVTPSEDSGSSSSGSVFSGSGSGNSVVIPKYQCVYSPEQNSAGVGGGASGTGPIVLDLNRNGITSISLAASTALFDYDGDGVLENTAWVENTDALLVNDVNGDGSINNASELFGNYTKNADGSIAKSGYQALSYYDTNNDGVVDATDTRFSELSLWIDSNQDGVTDAGELKTLSEMGVTSLKLNDPTTPYAPTVENTNTIIQETTFIDAQGEGIMRDVLFRYENTSQPTEGVYFDMDANGFKEKMTTWTAPNQWMVVKDINGDSTDTPIYPQQSNNNYYKRKIFTSNREIDTINNCFYMFKRKAA